jgi:predicted Zn-dependent protease
MRCIVAVLFLAFCLKAQDEKVAALGAQMAAQLLRESKPLAVPAVEQYVRNVVSQLDGQTDWQIQIVQTQRGGPTCEPSGFPPNYLFIPACLFLQAQSKAELAGMLAHSMSHALEYRSVQNPSSSTIPFIFASPMGSMKSELAADGKAVERMTDPNALLTYLQRRQEPDWRTNPLKAEIAEPFLAMQQEVRRVADIAASSTRPLPSLLHPN